MNLCLHYYYAHVKSFHLKQKNLFVSLIMAVGRCLFALCLLHSHFSSHSTTISWYERTVNVLLHLSLTILYFVSVVRVSIFIFQHISICFNLNENLLSKWCDRIVVAKICSTIHVNALETQSALTLMPMLNTYSFHFCRSLTISLWAVRATINSELAFECAMTIYPLVEEC